MQNPARESRKRPCLGEYLGLFAALPVFWWLRGFTIDDALIPARYAANIAAGYGYRFNMHGGVTDGVTPLGFPYLLAPFAKGGPLDALQAARALGIAWILAALYLGREVARLSGSRLRYASLLLIAFSAPLGAWSVSGLETGIVIALATVAATVPDCAKNALGGAALAGACAWLRPEMIAFSAILGAARALTAEKRLARILAVVLAVGPWILAAGIRWIVFGRPAPLAVLAKPSDLAHGAIYVLPQILFAGAPFAALAPLTWRTLPRWPRVLAIASFLHLAVVLLAGGDWMPLARLVTPVLPPLALVVAYLLRSASRASLIPTMGRLAIGCAAEIYVLARQGPIAAHVLGDRQALIEAARPVLENAAKVAAIDVGWVGATTDAEIVDLGGATDPQIAALPGGHTSKLISGAFLTGRAPDRLVLQVTAQPLDDAIVPARVAEARLFFDPLVTRSYRTTWRSPAWLPIHYVVMSLAPDTSRAP
jgi:hypothetical protein